MGKKKKNKGALGASHILVDKHSKAVDIIDELKAGKDFASLAKDHSLDASKKIGGNLGEFNKGDMVKEFQNALLRLKVGEFTDQPVKSKFGYHIIKRNK